MLGIAVLSTALLAPVAHAQQGFQRFASLLVDLPSWKASKADGMALEVAGSSMVTATRTYKRGDAKVTASVLTGPPAQGALAAANSGFKIETPEMHMTTSTIDGMQVTKTYTNSAKSGALLVALGGDAVFMFAYSGIDEDEAMGLAKTFDWKAIQAQAK